MCNFLKCRLALERDFVGLEGTFIGKKSSYLTILPSLSNNLIFRTLQKLPTSGVLNYYCYDYGNKYHNLLPSGFFGFQ